MKVSSFIARHLRFKGKIAVVAIAISFLVIIISVAVASGFRKEMQKGLSDMAGDIVVSYGAVNDLNEQDPVRVDNQLLEDLGSVRGVDSVRAVIYRYGIVKSDDRIQGVLVKGVSSDDTLALGVRIPRRLSKLMDLHEGDEMLTYFVSEKVKARKFKVTGVYDAMMDSPDNLVVFARLQDLQRLAGWDASEAGALEICLDPKHNSPQAASVATAEVAEVSEMMAQSLYDRYPSLFDWLNLVDGNVVAILFLMIVVAAFNMISGLLIMLFRSISTIGILKSMGMTDAQVSAAFLKVSARAVALGMAVGNAVALAFCLVQGKTHFLKLDPTNYFVPFVPVNVNPASVLTVDAVAFVAIMLFLLIPTLFISRVDPAKTVRTR